MLYYFFFSSPRIALRVKCRVRLAWLIKRLLCRLLYFYIPISSQLQLRVLFSRPEGVLVTRSSTVAYFWPWKAPRPFVLSRRSFLPQNDWKYTESFRFKAVDLELMCSLSLQDILLLFSSLVNNEVSTYGSHFTQVHQILSGVKLSSPFSAKSGVNGDYEYQKCDSRYDWKCYH